MTKRTNYILVNNSIFKLSQTNITPAKHKASLVHSLINLLTLRIPYNKNTIYKIILQVNGTIHNNKNIKKNCSKQELKLHGTLTYLIIMLRGRSFKNLILKINTFIKFIFFFHYSDRKR